MSGYCAGCPNGHSVWWGARYCGECGAQCYNTIALCPVCSDRLLEKQKFCTRCGHDLSTKPVGFFKYWLNEWKKE